MLNIRFEYVVVQNSKENTKYKVIDDIIYHKSKKRWLILEDVKIGKEIKIPIGYFCGNKRCIISENILKDSDGCSPRFLVAKIIDKVILLENEW